MANEERAVAMQAASAAIDNSQRALAVATPALAEAWSIQVAPGVEVVQDDGAPADAAPSPVERYVRLTQPLSAPDAEYETLVPWMVAGEDQETVNFERGARFHAGDAPGADLAGLLAIEAVRKVEDDGV